MDSICELLYSLVTLLVGVTATVIVTHIYYKRAGDELRKESQDLKILTELMLQAMEYAGMAEFARDEAGHIKSLNLKFSVPSGKLAFAGHRPEIKIDGQKPM